MTDDGHQYTPPARASTTTLPQAVEDFLNGDALQTKTQALRLSTVDADGWPHAGLLSAGDMLALPPDRIRFVCFAQSTMTANLLRDGRVTITLAADRGMCELRMRCHPLPQQPGDVPLAFFEATLLECREHRAPYADISGGVTFALHDPASVMPRWQRQIAAMRAI